MPKLADAKFPPDCQSLPEGFWSAVDVWLKKPHVVNKRLCGATETESRDVDAEELRALLDAGDGDGDGDLLQDASLFLCAGESASHREDAAWSSTVRTFIPKVNGYGGRRQKEVVLRDFDRQRVTFLPFEEDEAAGKATFKKGNIYQLRLCGHGCEQWTLELHVLASDGWFADGVAYPTLRWLTSELLPRLARWAAECRAGDFRSTLSLLPVEKYSLAYQQLKEKYKSMVQVWPEVTDPEKFVFEDVAIAAYLLVLWAEERAVGSLSAPQSFVDLGCGNGLLVHILTNEGHPGKGIDVRRRKIWDMYGPQTLLEEKAITPSESFLFPGTDWLIGNHSDELTPWIPVMAARSSYSCRFFVLPCCFFDFYAKYQRRQCKKSQYKEYIDFVAEVGQVCGFNTEEDCLRIPSTKRVCLVGTSRSYKQSDEADLEQRRARYIQSRRASAGAAVQRSGVGKDGNCCHGSPEPDGTSGSALENGFQPRNAVETVRNCAALPRDFVDRVVLKVATALLGMSEGTSVGGWNKGGSLSVKEVAALLEQETLQLLKKECGGLQTLLKNNHQVFKVEGGTVYIRDWRDKTESQRRPTIPGALKTRLCWFHAHHPQGCPLQGHNCTFAHGEDDLRPSTRPLKKLKTV